MRPRPLTRTAAFGYDVGDIYHIYLPLGVLLTLRLASEATAVVAYLGLAVYALLGRGHAIRALAASWLFTMVNTELAPEGGGASAGRYIIMLSAAVSVFFHGTVLTGSKRVQWFTVKTIALGAFIIVHSLLISPIKDVSILKASSWLLVMATTAAAWSGMQKRELDRQSKILFWWLVSILVASLPLLAISSGYAVNGTGFQGILNHPQAFGLTMSILCAWANTKLVTESRPSWILLGIAAMSFVMVFLSEARTAGLSAILAISFSLALAPSLARRSILNMAPGLKSVRLWTLIFIALIAGIGFAPFIAERAQVFITKSGRSDAGGLFAAYEQSRGDLMDRMLENIGKYPITGIGFGIASDPTSMIVDRDPLIGLPTGAAIEKGVVPIAVVEELGLFGAIFVAMWIWALLLGSARSGISAFAVCLTAILLNMGEATLFSPGGFGMLPLILFGWSFADGQNSMGRHRYA